MSYAPIFAVCFADANVRALLGDNPMRLFLFDEAPEGVSLPYVVWQEISGNPFNSLEGFPDKDKHRIQLDVYGVTASSSRQVKSAIEDAIINKAYVVSFNGESKDKETGAYRSSFDISWIVDH